MTFPSDKAERFRYQDKIWLHDRYWNDQLSIREIAHLVNVSTRTIRHWMKKHGISKRTISEGLKGKYTGDKAPRWRGGRVQNGNGYIRVMVPRHPCADKYGYVYEHRLIVEKALGRYLNSKELVHHINGERGDNHLENLELIDHHRRRTCPRCGWPMNNLLLGPTPAIALAKCVMEIG